MWVELPHCFLFDLTSETNQASVPAGGRIMFERLKKLNVVASTPSTMIAVGTEVHGSVCSRGYLQVYGRLTGSVVHRGFCVIGPTARVAGAIKADAAAVAGQVDGEVEVEGKLELLPGSMLLGDLRCGHLVIHDLTSLQPTQASPSHIGPRI